jgi:hypothetical protein
MKIEVEKAKDWLDNQDITKYISVLYSGACHVSFSKDRFIEDFIKAMEE